jgi:glycosyltransferase involved in cell wall biosynthesis
LKISILGTRGIPANHGGFETFAEQLALYLAEGGHDVTVYCQTFVKAKMVGDTWRGIRRITLHGYGSPLGTMKFDWTAARHASSQPGLILTLGYNTAIFSILYRIKGKLSLLNMDGIEWKREKWTPLQRLWLRLNERAGAMLSNHLIADHPEIAKHLEGFVAKEKISVIPYGADPVEKADARRLSFGLSPYNYALVIARPEPENSLLEIVEAFSRKNRGIKLVILGQYYPEAISYHSDVMRAAGPEVVFAGAVYDREVVRTLRYFARTYIHGHRVGGTNPSLVESLAAGNPVIAHDNRFTRWVAGPEQRYFDGSCDLSDLFDEVLDDPIALKCMSAASHRRWQESFLPMPVLASYEKLLLSFAVPECAVSPDGIAEKETSGIAGQLRRRSARNS